MSQHDIQETKTSSDMQDRQAPETQTDVQGMEPSSTTHKMSIALTIGLTIGVIGLVILLYGLFGSADFRRSDGINIDLWWGLLMVVFGVIMSIGGYLSAHRQATH